MKRKTIICLFAIYLITSSFFIYNYLFLPFEDEISRLVVDLSEVLYSPTLYVCIGLMGYSIYLFFSDKKVSWKTLVAVLLFEVLFIVAPLITSHLKGAAVLFSLVLGSFASYFLVLLLSRAGRYSGRSLYIGIVVCSYHMLLRVLQDSFRFETDMTKSLQPWGLLVVMCFIMYELVFRNTTGEPESTAMIIPMSAINTLLFSMAFCIIFNNNCLDPLFNVLKYLGLPVIAVFMCIDRFWLRSHSDTVFLN